MNLVRQALTHSPKTHGVYLVWHALWEDRLTNGELVRALGFTRTTVRQNLKVLSLLGLVRPIQLRRRGGFERILVQGALQPNVLALLNDVLAGRAVVDRRRTVVRRDGESVDLSASLDDTGVPSGPGVHFLGVSNTPTVEVLGVSVETHSIYSNKLYKPVTETSDVTGSITKETSNSNKKRGVGKNKSGAETRRTPQNPEEASQMWEVFRHWQTATNMTQLGLTNSRKELILGRLRQGYTVDQLKAVVTWAVQDPWMSGKDPNSTSAWLTLASLIGSDNKVDKYLEKAATQPLVKTSGRSLAANDSPRKERVI